MPYLIDTNVVSELRRKSADPCVLNWQAQYDLTESWISVLTLMEIRIGIERVRPTDQPFAERLSQWYKNTLLAAYKDRTLPIDLAICETRVLFDTRRTLPLADALIGATAKHHNLTLATRNTKDFEGLGIQLVNPWKHQTP